MKDVLYICYNLQKKKKKKKKNRQKERKKEKENLIPFVSKPFNSKNK